MVSFRRFRGMRGSALRQMRFAGRVGFMGDPGFFSKLKKLSLKKILKGAGPFLPLLGGPMGAAATLLGGVAGAGPLAPIGAGLAKLPRPNEVSLSPLPGVGFGFPLGPGGGRTSTGRRINPKTGKAYRHMNILNPQALRRSMRRVEGFAHFARKTISFTHKVHMKKKGRRR
jgi:hypothetical protein